jgi:hypothetical protein
MALVFQTIPKLSEPFDKNKNHYMTDITLFIAVIETCGNSFFEQFKWNSAL